MRSATRALTGLATTVALTAGLLATSITAAVAVPTKPTIASVTASGGTFTPDAQPAAGTELNPKVLVTGVASGDTVTIYVGTAPSTPGVAPAATCAATATSVTFNDPSGNCTVPANFTVGTADGDFIFEVTRTSGAAGTSPRSDPFEYIRDSVAPGTLAAAPTVTKKPGAAIQVQFGLAQDAAPFASGVTSYNVYRSQRDPGAAAGTADQPTTIYSKVGTVLASACSGTSATACTFNDPPPGPSVDPADGHAYYYKVTATDKAANEGAKSAGSTYITADGTPPTTPSGLTVTPDTAVHDAGFGNDTTPTIAVTLGGAEATTVKLLVNSVVVNTQAIASGTTSYTWNSGGGAVVDLVSDGVKSITVSATDSVGNTSTSGATSYTLDTIAPAAPAIDSVSNETTSTVNNNDNTPQVVVSGVASNDHMVLDVNKVNTGDATSTKFERVSTGSSPFAYNPDNCEPSCTFTLGGPAPQTTVFTASARDQAGNVSGSNPAVTYIFNTVGPSVSTILSMGSPPQTTSPASGTDRTPNMVVRVSNDATQISIFRGTSTTPIGTVQVSTHTVTCPSAVASTVCVELNRLSTDSDFLVGAGANLLKARAFDAAHNPRDSAQFEWDGTDTKAPPAPNKPTTSLGSAGALSIDWNDVTDAPDNTGASSNPVTYQVVKASAAPDGSGVCPDPTTLTFTSLHTGLTASQDSDTLSPIRNCYFYRVRATDGAGNTSLYSPISDAAGDRTAPTTPDAPVGVLGSAGSVSLDWNTVTDSSSPVTYNLYRASTAPSAGVCPDSTGLTFTLLQSNLTSSDATDTISPINSCYFYKVDATDGAANTSAKSASSAAVGDVTPPATVAKPTVSKRSAGHNVVSWTAVTDPAPADNPVTYELDRATADPGTPNVESTCPTLPSTSYSTLVASQTGLSYTDTTTTNGKCTYYRVIASDSAGNSASPSAASDAVLVNTSAGPPTPTITSVNGSSTSPAYGSGAGSDTPTVVASVTEGAGTLRLFVDGSQVASKAVSAPGPVTIISTDYTGAVPVRSHTLTVDQVANSTTSSPSPSFTYARPPAAPTITKVAGSTTSPATDNTPQPGVVVAGLQPGDVVKIYADNDCGGPNSPVLVAQKNGVASTTYSTVVGDWTTSLAIGTYCLTATTTAPSIADSNFATSAPSAAFTYNRKPQVNGYLLDSYGGIHPVNGAPATTNGPYFGFDIARDIVMLPDKTGGFVLDGYGGIHGFGIGANPKPATPAGGPYFSGFDIARSIVLVTATSGYVLDGYGGVHPFGGAPAISGAPYFGFDIARRLVMTGATSGYVLDGYGAAHPFGGAPAITTTPYYSFDIARDLVLTGSGRGYELDGYGGIHPFGGAPAAPTSSYTGGSDVARSLVVTETDLDGGLMLDGYGRVSTFGDALPIPRPAIFAGLYAKRIVVNLF